MPTIYGPNTKGLGHLLAECADDRSPFAKAVDHYCDGLHVRRFLRDRGHGLHR
jgi:hypothetical protein